MASEKKLTLKSYDGEIFEIEKSAAVKSRMLKNMIEDKCASDTIPVPNVDGKTLAMVVEYCKKHANKDDEDEDDEDEDEDKDSVEEDDDGEEEDADDVDEEEEEEEEDEEEEDDDDDDVDEEEDDDESDKDDDLKSFDSEFYEKDQAILYDLIMAANYLDIPELLGGLCRKVADMIRGKSPDEIRKTFNIVNDLSPEEEEEIRNQNAWAFE